MTDEDEAFRFIVHILPPRRPTNSLFRSASEDEPVRKLAVPARASQTFEDVWNNTHDRFVRSYGPEIVAKTWFHKLQDRNGADIDAQDGVGQLGYNSKTPREDLELHMLQNFVDSEGSLPDNTGLRPPNYRNKRRRNLEEEDSGYDEHEEQAKRLRLRDELAGLPVEDSHEDLVEVPQDVQEPENSQQESDTQPRVDADGFTVPALPQSHKKNKRRKGRLSSDVSRIPSSIEGEEDGNVIVGDPQHQQDTQDFDPEILASEPYVEPHGHGSDAEPGNNGGSHSGMSAATGDSQMERHAIVTQQSSSARSKLTADRRRRSESTELERHDTEAAATKQKRKVASPPTPVSHDLTQEPPESAQRPRPSITPTPRYASNVERPGDKAIASARLNFQTRSVDEDPIEDDVLLRDLGPTPNDDDHDEFEDEDDADYQPYTMNKRLGHTRTHDGSQGTHKLPKRAVTFHQTPKSSASKFEPGSQKSALRNPRSQIERKSVWSPAEDAFLVTAMRLKLTASETKKRFDLSGRSASAVRARRILLQAKDSSVTDLTRDEQDAGVDGQRLSQSSQRKTFSSTDVKTICRALSDGFDALEIHAIHFPNRTEDSVTKKCIALQDNAWTLARKHELFPDDAVHLEGWTTKDSCKLKRAFREGMPFHDMRARYFARFSDFDIRKKADAYKAQIKALENRHSSVSKAATSSAGHEHVFSSPLQRTMQSRGAHSGSALPTPLRASQTSSPPSQHSASTARLLENPRNSHGLQNLGRAASPTVHVHESEQILAQAETAGKAPLNRAPAGSGGQTTLNFIREKGKGRAGPPPPNTAELDALYNRRRLNPEQSAAEEPVESPEAQGEVMHDTVQAIDNEGEDEFGAYTPVDDLDMLASEIEREQRESSTPQAIAGADQSLEVEDYQADAAAAETGLEEPKATHATPSKTTRELHSVHITPMPEVDSIDLAISPSKSTVADRGDHATPAVPQEDSSRSTGRQTRSPPPRADAQGSDASFEYSSSGFKRPKTSNRVAAQLSKELQQSIPPKSRTPGKLPGRAQSYASRIRDAGPPTATRVTATPRSPLAATPSAIELKPEANDDEAPLPRDQRSPTPTDASIWALPAINAKVGLSRRELFEDLKQSTLSLHYARYRDREALDRVNAEGRRRRRERKVASGRYVSTDLETQHPAGPAQGGDDDSADEDVIRIDDTPHNDFLSDEDGDGDYDESRPRSDAESSELEEPMDHNRHFSEVEDEVKGKLEEPEAAEDADNGVPKQGMDEAEEELELPTVPTMMQDELGTEDRTADENVQDPANSGGEGSPAHPSSKRKFSAVATTEEEAPSAKRIKSDPCGSSAMPPPSTSKVNKSPKSKRKDKRAARRRRHTQQAARSGSERSSSVTALHAGSSDVRRGSSSTPASCVKKGYPTPMQPSSTDMAPSGLGDMPLPSSQHAPTSAQPQGSSSRQKDAVSTQTVSSNLRNLLARAHLPSPPRSRPPVPTVASKFTLPQTDDESDSSSEGSS